MCVCVWGGCEGGGGVGGGGGGGGNGGSISVIFLWASPGGFFL